MHLSAEALRARSELQLGLVGDLSVCRQGKLHQDHALGHQHHYILLPVVLLKCDMLELRKLGIP